MLLDRPGPFMYVDTQFPMGTQGRVCVCVSAHLKRVDAYACVDAQKQTKDREKEKKKIIW